MPLPRITVAMGRGRGTGVFEVELDTQSGTTKQLSLDLVDYYNASPPLGGMTFAASALQWQYL